HHKDRNTGDVTIKIEGKIFKVHKDILIDRIPFFRGLFNSNMLECTQEEIDLTPPFSELDYSAFDLLLNYAYTGLLIMSFSNVQNLMMGANFLNMESVVEECIQFIKRHLDIDVALPFLFFCRSIGYNEVDDYVLRFFDKNFVPISYTAEFLELLFEDLRTFLQRDNLNVDHEKQASLYNDGKRNIYKKNRNNKKTSKDVN
ncbi:hypothetical protein PMAYCL1PPCAC_13302, partial [Pristionchus mayeri]